MTQRIIKISDMPKFPDGIDKLWKDGENACADVDGRRMDWVSIGWIDDGLARGDEPIKIVEG